MSDPANAEGAPRASHDVVRGRPPRFVDDEHAVHDTGRVWSPSAIASARRSRISSRTALSGPGTVKPAAFLCPPPPNSLATRRTSTSYFERMLTRTSPLDAALKKTTAWI